MRGAFVYLDRPMPQHIALSDLAEIKPGYAFRGKIEANPDGDTFVLQPSSVGLAGDVDVDDLIRVSDVIPRDYHRVTPDAVLLVAYGTRNRAFRFEHLPEATIASSTFYLIRPDVARLDPGFLAWFLNQHAAQAEIESLRAGVSVQIVKRDSLGGLTVPMPTLDVQRRTATMAALADREARLTHALLERRRAYLDAALMRAVA